MSIYSSQYGLESELLKGGCIGGLYKGLPGLLRGVLGVKTIAHTSPIADRCWVRTAHLNPEPETAWQHFSATTALEHVSWFLSCYRS